MPSTPLHSAGTGLGNTLLLWACPELEHKVYVHVAAVRGVPPRCKRRFRNEPRARPNWFMGDHISLVRCAWPAPPFMCAVPSAGRDYSGAGRLGHPPPSGHPWAARVRLYPAGRPALRLTYPHALQAGRSDAELADVFALVRSPKARLASGFHWVHKKWPNASEAEICSTARASATAHMALGSQVRTACAGHRTLERVMRGMTLRRD